MESEDGWEKVTMQMVAGDASRLPQTQRGRVAWAKHFGGLAIQDKKHQDCQYLTIPPVKYLHDL